MIPVQYRNWKVYLYEPKSGAIDCPRCRQRVKSLPGNPMMPPWICATDQIFFDPCMDPTILEKRTTVGGVFKAGDLQLLINKYAAIGLLR